MLRLMCSILMIVWGKMKSSADRNKGGAGKGDRFRGSPKKYREGLERIFRNERKKSGKD